MLDAGRSVDWYEASARERIAALLDPGSFTEFVGPEQREQSPHLCLFDLPAAFDDGVIVGRGRLDDRQILIAAQEGRFMGGAIGEVHGAKLLGLLQAARLGNSTWPVVLILFDTGGVRLQEANAGEIAIAEIMRALLDARAVGVQVIGLIGGRAGCFGGGGLIAACCSGLIMSEHGRLAVTGPEVIESNKGVEEFDSADRALIWRTLGGKHRRLLGGVNLFADDTVESFKQAALVMIGSVSAFDLATLTVENTRLESRLSRFGTMTDATEIWRLLGVTQPESVPDLSADEFRALVATIEDAGRDSR